MTKETKEVGLAAEFHEGHMALQETLYSLEQTRGRLKRAKEKLNTKTYPDRMRAAKAANDGGRRLLEVIDEHQQNQVAYYSAFQAIGSLIERFEQEHKHLQSMLARVKDAIATGTVTPEDKRRLQVNTLLVVEHLERHKAYEWQAQPVDQELMTSVAAVRLQFALVMSGKGKGFLFDHYTNFALMPYRLVREENSFIVLHNELVKKTHELVEATVGIKSAFYRTRKQAINHPQFVERLTKALVEQDTELEAQLEREHACAKALLQEEHDELTAQVQVALHKADEVQRLIGSVSAIPEETLLRSNQYSELMCTTIAADAAIRSLHHKHGKLIKELEVPFLQDEGDLLSQAFNLTVEAELKRRVGRWGTGSSQPSE